MATAVTTASVPSLPARSPTRFQPTLSFHSPFIRRMTDPSASTASRPTTRVRIGPWRMTWMPPALVATIPPRVAESLAARSMPSSWPIAPAARCALPSVVPAPACRSKEVASQRVISSRRRVDRINGAGGRERPAPSGRAPGAERPGVSPRRRGTEPPTRPVLPPCGTTSMPASRQQEMTFATCAVSAGRATARHGAPKRPVQSDS